VPSRKTRVIGRKLYCLNPNPQRCNRTPAATASQAQRYQGPLVRFCERPPPTGKTMRNDLIEGDEWGAYFTLDTFNFKRNAGLPTGRES
jgi:hypothetical protein